MGKFHGMTKFTIADFNKGYWMVELDPESSKYTTMALGHWKISVDETSNGFHCLHKMCSRGKLDAIFLSVPGVTGIADDMIIYRRNDQKT